MNTCRADGSGSVQACRVKMPRYNNMIRTLLANIWGHNYESLNEPLLEQLGQTRELNSEERRMNTSELLSPTHIVIFPYTMVWRTATIEVPIGFLLKLRTGWSYADIVRQFLYYKHEFSCGTRCTREIANEAVRSIRGRWSITDVLSWLNFRWSNTLEWEASYGAYRTVVGSP